MTMKLPVPFPLMHTLKDWDFESPRDGLLPARPCFSAPRLSTPSRYVDAPHEMVLYVANDGPCLVWWSCASPSIRGKFTFLGGLIN
jgi:hypothetical protein